MARRLSNSRRVLISNQMFRKLRSSAPGNDQVNQFFDTICNKRRFNDRGIVFLHFSAVEFTAVEFSAINAPARIFFFEEGCLPFTTVSGCLPVPFGFLPAPLSSTEALPIQSYLISPAAPADITLSSPWLTNCQRVETFPSPLLSDLGGKKKGGDSRKLG